MGRDTVRRGRANCQCRSVPGQPDSAYGLRQGRQVDIRGTRHPAHPGYPGRLVCGTVYRVCRAQQAICHRGRQRATGFYRNEVERDWYRLADICGEPDVEALKLRISAEEFARRRAFWLVEPPLGTRLDLLCGALGRLLACVIGNLGGEPPDIGEKLIDFL